MDRLKNKNGISYDKRIPSSSNVCSVDFSFFFFFLSLYLVAYFLVFLLLFFFSTSQRPSYPRFPAGPSRFLSP